MKNDNPNNLTDKQKKFSEAFAYGATRGNGVLSYALAYGIDISKKGQYAVAASGARENLKKPHILSYIRDLYESDVLSDEIVDNELSFLISQSAELNTKLGAIKEYNKLKGRIIDRSKAEIEVKQPLDLSKLSDDELSTYHELVLKTEPK